MILAEPPRTPYDLNFQLLGFPVRIHPLFWLVGFVAGFGNGSDGVRILIWMLVILVSILVHELGHALLMRRFGKPAHIVLHWMGGLAIEGEESPYSSFSSFSSQFSGSGRRSRTPWEQILISLAGPGAGFVLAAVVWIAVVAAGGRIGVEFSGVLPDFQVTLPGGLEQNHHLQQLVIDMLWVNVLWGLINLLPVLPLDGGQVAQQLFLMNDPWQGMVRTLWLSVLVGGVAAVAFAVLLQQSFAAILFASLAVSSFFTLQQLTGRGRPW